jgi:AcrR family transcriptional regulator
VILAAAREVIAERGYEAATIRSIAQRAHVDPRLVRYYFRSKRALAGEALAEVELGAALAADCQLAERSPAVWDRYPLEWSVLVASAVSVEPEVRQAFVQEVGRLVDSVKGPDDPSGLRTLLAFSHLLGIWMLTGLEASPFHDPQLQRQLLEHAAWGHLQPASDRLAPSPNAAPGAAPEPMAAPAP